MARKWNIVNDQWNEYCDVGNEIIYNTEVLKSNLCDYNHAYNLVRGYIIVTAAHATQISFKNCKPFTECVTNIYGTTIDDAEDLDLVMPAYNLLEYSSNHSEATGNLWFYSIDKETYFDADNLLLIIIILNLSSIRLNY